MHDLKLKNKWNGINDRREVDKLEITTDFPWRLNHYMYLSSLTLWVSVCTVSNLKDENGVTDSIYPGCDSLVTLS